MSEEQKRILSHLKYVDGLGRSDGYLEKALKLIDELTETIKDLEEEIEGMRIEWNMEG